MALSTENKDKHETIKVLIADDDPPTRILLKAAISQWGYLVIEARDGEEVWEILQQNNAPELLILDWIMPKLDGIGLCERVKQELSLRPYIILLTQVTGTTNIIKGLEAGADEFLSKPFNMAELRSRLSVGTRIIAYKNALAKQNTQLQNYISEVDNVIDQALETTQHINEIFQSDNTSEHTLVDATSRQKIHSLNTKLNELIDLLKSFNSAKS